MGSTASTCALRCTVRRLVARETVSNTGNRLDKAGVCRIGLDLTAQPADVDPHKLDLMRVAGSPDALQQHLVRENSAGVLGQRAQQFELRLAERGGLARDRSRSLLEVHLQFT